MLSLLLAAEICEGGGAHLFILLTVEHEHEHLKIKNYKKTRSTA